MERNRREMMQCSESFLFLRGNLPVNVTFNYASSSFKNNLSMQVLHSKIIIRSVKIEAHLLNAI